MLTKYTMKWRLHITVTLLLLSGRAHAQVSFNWNEWFKQKKTEIKYLGQQIASLQIYLNYVKKGYQIVDQGNRLIQQAKSGELNLHDVFYLSLKIVNQQIKNYPAVRKTIEHHNYIATTSTKLLRAVREKSGFDDRDRQYVEETLARLREDMSASLDELMIVLADGELELQDDERIRKITELEAYASARVVFVKEYYAHVMGKAVQVSGERAESAVLRSLHGLRD